MYFYYKRCNICDPTAKFPPGVFLKDKKINPCLKNKNMKGRFYTALHMSFSWNFRYLGFITKFIALDVITFTRSC